MTLTRPTPTGTRLTSGTTSCPQISLAFAYGPPLASDSSLDSCLAVTLAEGTQAGKSSERLVPPPLESQGCHQELSGCLHHVKYGSHCTVLALHPTHSQGVAAALHSHMRSSLMQQIALLFLLRCCTRFVRHANLSQLAPSFVFVTFRTPFFQA